MKIDQQCQSHLSTLTMGRSVFCREIWPACGVIVNILHYRLLRYHHTSMNCLSNVCEMFIEVHALSIKSIILCTHLLSRLWFCQPLGRQKSWHIIRQVCKFGQLLAAKTTTSSSSGEKRTLKEGFHPTALENEAGVSFLYHNRKKFSFLDKMVSKMLNNIIIFDFPLRVVFQTIFCSFVYDGFVHIQLRSILVYVKFTNFLHMCSTMFALGLIKIWGNFIAPILLSSKIKSISIIFYRTLFIVI